MLRTLLLRRYFSIQVEPTEKSKSGANYYAANGSEIKNLGKQTVKAESDGGVPMNIDFDVGDKLTRPLLSVFEMITKKNRVVYDEDESYILHKPTNREIPLKLDNKLFYLDVWVKVPRALSRHPFVRQVADQ